MKNKIISTILTLLLLITLVGCKKENVISSNKEFIEIYYEYYAGIEDKDFVGIDLRDYETRYTKGHLKGFISFDYYPSLVEGDIKNDTYRDRFREWVTINYSKDTVIFVVDDKDQTADKIRSVLEGCNYEEFYVYQKGYDKLIEANEGLIEIVTGGNSCDC